MYGKENFRIKWNILNCISIMMNVFPSSVYHVRELRRIVIFDVAVKYLDDIDL